MLDGKAKDFVDMLQAFAYRFGSLQSAFVESENRRVVYAMNFAIQYIRQNFRADIDNHKREVVETLLRRNLMRVEVINGYVTVVDFFPMAFRNAADEWIYEITFSGDGYHFTLDKLNRIAAHVEQHGWNDSIEPIVVKESVAAEPADDTDVMMAN